MSKFENPFDDTIRDLFGEHDIEDSMHGAESVMRRIDTLPMPLPDGTYWVFGDYDFNRYMLI